MSSSTRCLVTGHDKSGRSVVVHDGAAENSFTSPNRRGVTLTDIWKTDTTPARIDAWPELGGKFELKPPKGGTVFRVIEFKPEDPDQLRELKGVSAFSEMGAGDAVDTSARHPFMHRTDTVDYAIVLSGEIYMLLDDSEHLLRAGDIVVQRGTNHAWSNRGSDPCVMAFVLIDGR